MIVERAVGGVRRVPWVLLPVLWLAMLGVLAWWLPEGSDLLSGLAVTPALACAAGARSRWVLASGVMALAVLSGELADDSLDGSGTAIGSAATAVAAIMAGMWTAGRSTRLFAELDHTREIAAAAQQVLLRPLPRSAGAWSVAGEYVSASRGARVGGDLYEVLTTPFGVRALIGDARGHGLPAIGVVAALLGSFREAAHQEPDLTGVLHRLDGSLRRHLRDRGHGEHPAAAGTAFQDPEAEEFATLQLVQLTDDGVFQAVNCGHPPPYLLGRRTCPLPLGDPLPPLGLFDPARTATPVACGRIATGDGLLLYTDGMQDARDRTGRFFPLPDTLARAAAGRPLSGQNLAETLRTAVQRHTGGRLTDDLALLILIRDAPRFPDPPRTPLLAGVPRA